MWFLIQAHSRHRDAQRAWSAEHGVDYADTFHPEWRRHLEHRPDQTRERAR
jgi:hypothetical protein